MHRVIRIIVFASNRKEALATGKEILDKLCGEDKLYDYYTTFDDKTSTISGSARWGKLPAVSKASSKMGKMLIAQGMKFTRDEIIGSLQKVREGLQKYSDEEIFTEEPNAEHKLEMELDVATHQHDMLDSLPMVKFYMYICGGSSASSNYLYDQDGEAIDNPRRLENVLNKWPGIEVGEEGKNPYKDLEIWVIPADVHY